MHRARRAYAFVIGIVCTLLVRGSQGSGQDTHNPLEHIQLFNAVDERLNKHSLTAQIDVNVTEVVGKSAWVEVTWSGFKSPSFDDWIGVLAPADAHIKHSTPVKYVRAAQSKSHLMNGSGRVTCASPYRSVPHGVPSQNMLFESCQLNMAYLRRLKYSSGALDSMYMNLNPTMLRS